MILFFLQLQFWFWSHDLLKMDSSGYITLFLSVCTKIRQTGIIQQHRPTCTFVALFRCISPVCSNMCLSHGSVFNSLFTLVCHAAPSHKVQLFLSSSEWIYFSFYIFFLIISIFLLTAYIWSLRFEEVC